MQYLSEKELVNEMSHKYLAFCLNEKNYAFSILKVNEVIVLPEITPMPKTPPYLRGVINLRGQIIPIIDLRLALGLEEVQYDKQTCIVIVKMKLSEGEKLVGFIVDSVSEVFEIQATDIESPPNYGERLDDDFLSGIGKVRDKIVMLLDIDKILASEAQDFLYTEN